MCAQKAKMNQESRVILISKAKKYIASKKYNVIMQGTTIKTKRCEGKNGCGQRMVGAIKPDKSKVFWVCMNRFHSDEVQRCNNWRNGALPAPVQNKVDSGSGLKKNPVSTTFAGVKNNV